jgi:hypothetical protein
MGTRMNIGEQRRTIYIEPIKAGGPGGEPRVGPELVVEPVMPREPVR